MRVRGRALPNSVQMVAEFYNVTHPVKVVLNKKLLQGKRLSKPSRLKPKGSENPYHILLSHNFFFPFMEGHQQRIEPGTRTTRTL